MTSSVHDFERWGTEQVRRRRFNLVHNVIIQETVPLEARQILYLQYAAAQEKRRGGNPHLPAYYVTVHEVRNKLIATSALKPFIARDFLQRLLNDPSRPHILTRETSGDHDVNINRSNLRDELFREANFSVEERWAYFLREISLQPNLTTWKRQVVNEFLLLSPQDHVRIFAWALNEPEPLQILSTILGENGHLYTPPYLKTPGGAGEFCRETAPLLLAVWQDDYQNYRSNKSVLQGILKLTTGSAEADRAGIKAWAEKLYKGIRTLPPANQKSWSSALHELMSQHFLHLPLKSALCEGIKRLNNLETTQLVDLLAETDTEHKQIIEELCRRNFKVKDQDLTTLVKLCPTEAYGDEAWVVFRSRFTSKDAELLAPLITALEKSTDHVSIHRAERLWNYLQHIRTLGALKALRALRTSARFGTRAEKALGTRIWAPFANLLLD